MMRTGKLTICLVLIVLMFGGVVEGGVEGVEITTWKQYWPTNPPYQIAVTDVGIYLHDILWLNPDTGLIQPISEFESLSVRVGFFNDYRPCGYLDLFDPDTDVLWGKYLIEYWLVGGPTYEVLGLGERPNGVIVTIDFSPQTGFAIDEYFNGAIVMNPDVLVYASGVITNIFNGGYGEIYFASTPSGEDFVLDALDRLVPCGAFPQMSTILLVPEPATVALLGLGFIGLRRRKTQ